MKKHTSQLGNQFSWLTLRHILLNVWTLKEKNIYIVTSRQKDQVTHKGNKIRLSSGSLAINLYERHKDVFYLSYSIKKIHEQGYKWTSCRKAAKYYEHASAQRLSFLWTVSEESIREWASWSKINLRGRER